MQPGRNTTRKRVLDFGFWILDFGLIPDVRRRYRQVVKVRSSYRIPRVAATHRSPLRSATSIQNPKSKIQNDPRRRLSHHERKYPIRSRIWSILIPFLTLVPAASTQAWGPATEQAVVATAVRVLSREGVVQLSKLERDIRDGAAASADVVAGIYPGYATDPVRAIETEMYLLDTVRGDAVDPYFANRLGVLGQVVAGLSSPLLNADRSIRDRFYADAESNMQQLPLKPSQRRLVDPVPYFERARRLADEHAAMIIKDYQDGGGFNGIAKATLAEGLSRSTDAVLDVWKTVLTQNVVHANVSDEQVRKYVLGAMGFYIKRDNEAEIDANYKRLAGLTKKTPDMAKRIGDMFYGADLYDRAIAEYREVLAAEPDRRDVVTRIAEYYVKQGDEALKAKRLQQAYDCFANAAHTDPLHPEAERKRLEAEKLIAERDARLEAARRSVEEGAQLQTDAEQQVMQRRTSEAIATLQRAQAAYAEVPDEFLTEFRAANAGLANIASRMNELRGELTQNAQMLSGVGFLPDMQRLAATAGKGLDDQGLRDILANQLNAQINGLKVEYQDKLSIAPVPAQ